MVDSVNEQGQFRSILFLHELKPDMKSNFKKKTKHPEPSSMNASYHELKTSFGYLFSPGFWPCAFVGNYVDSK